MLRLPLVSLMAVMFLWSCTPAKQQEKTSIIEGVKVTVTVSQPQWTTKDEVLTVSGEIHAKDEVQVVAETTGKVTVVNVDAGSRVTKGDILAQMEDEVKQANLVSSQVNYDKAKSDWDKAQQLFAEKVISDSDLQTNRLALANATAQLTTVRKDFEDTKVRSPLTGIVTEKNVSVGVMLSPGLPVARVIDISQLKLVVSIAENSILKLRKGQPVSIEATPYPGKVFSGSVFAISPKSSSSLIFPVEIDMKNDSETPLYDGMLATAKISLGKRSLWSIPRVCIVGSLQKPQVFVIETGKARLKNILVGSDFGTDIEVIQGLDKSDQVVVNGQNNLDDGSAVEIVTGDRS
jgi:RND family efflux transporter MFP subunit